MDSNKDEDKISNLRITFNQQGKEQITASFSK